MGKRRGFAVRLAAGGLAETPAGLLMPVGAQGQHSPEKGQKVRTGIMALQHIQTGKGLFLPGLLGQLAAHKEAEALVAVAFAEGEARRHTVMRRDVQGGVAHVHGIDVDRGQTADGGQQFVADVGRFHAGQAAQRDDRALQQPVDVVQPLELAQAGGLVTGVGAEISRQLRHFGHGADGRLGRTGGRAGGEDDLRAIREGGRVPGQRGHGGQGHAQRKVLEHEADALRRETAAEIGQHRVVQRVHVDAGRGRAFPVDAAADVSLHQFAQSLQEGFLRAVAGRGAVEFAQQLEPVQRRPDRLPVRKPRGRIKGPAHGGQHLPRGFRRERIIHGAQDLLHRHELAAEALFRLLPGGRHHVGPGLPEAEEGVALHEFHERRGLRLFGGRALAHLLARGHDAPGIPAADAQIDRYAEPARIHAAGLGQHVQAGIGQGLPDAFDGLSGADALVQIAGISLGAGAELDGRIHARSTTSRE